LYQYRNGIIIDLQPMQTIYVEGLPGTGKTFIINTLRNIVKIIYRSNVADAASAPTECTAALIEGSTHARMMKISIGREAVKAPFLYSDYKFKSTQILARYIPESDYNING
jgi:hypothetical protein